MPPLALTFLDGLALLGGGLAVGLILLAAWICETHSAVGKEFDDDEGGAQ